MGCPQDGIVCCGRADRIRAVVVQIVHVFLLHLDIVAIARAVEVAADEVGKIVLEDLVMCGDEARYIFHFAEAREGSPAGKDDVDEHEDFLCGGVDEDVAFEVVLAFV